WLDSDERLQAIIISKGTKEANMVVPEMSVKEVASAVHFTKHYWKDGENALEVLGKLLPNNGTISVDNLWPSFQLLELMKIKKDLTYIPSTKVLAKLRLHKDDHEIDM